jgi:hypothetical protein
VPERFAPSAMVGWMSRGQNASRERRAELRKVATTRIAADAKRAKVEIERASVELQGELVAGGLSSNDAKAFLARMPTAEALLPVLAGGEAEAQVAEGPDWRRRLGR